MAKEIERKFLVGDDRWRDEVPTSKAEKIIQGYLHASDTHSVRIRLQDGDAKLTVKGATRGITRAEFEYDIPAEDAEAMLELCGDRRVEKRRYVTEYEGKEWIIDEFDGDNDGLVVAEIELDDEDEAFDKPGWLGDEVSDRPEYYNANLARHPYSAWRDEDAG